MKILIFGAGGQIGHEVCRAAWPSSYEVLPLDRSAGDVTHPAALSALIASRRPDLVINLAAYTAVDRAESEPEAAWAANCAGAAHLAATCEENSAPLIHLSTDYVFDGRKRGSYTEDEPVNPLCVYGCSKEAGERAVRAAALCHIIIRTSWVYGVHGNNFVKTMLRLAGERQILRVVADQQGCPTAAADIASALTMIARQIDQGTARWGTFHFAGAGDTSWHGFAEEILDLESRFGARPSGSRPQIEPVTTAQYPTPARRPMNSVLDCRKIAEAYGVSAPPWRTSLAAVVRELIDQKRPR
ncbi:MAG: dTDP-4-dehydrorhamnose reductase [Alphaproteobacteria bacterium]|nr:dTDP-4-dehydrorhamnose reductase [Alphaproteobacteria bacterium]